MYTGRAWEILLVVGDGFLSRSYLALCMLKLHVVKHMPGTRAWYFAATPQQAAQDSVDAMRSGDPSSSKATRRRSQRKRTTYFTRTQTPGHLHTLGCLVPSALRASARGRDERWLVRVPGPTRDGRCAEACGRVLRGA